MLDSALKVSVIVACALGVNGLLPARSAALRHWVLAAALGCGLAVPMLEVLVPAWSVPFVRGERGQPDGQILWLVDATPAPQTLVVGSAQRVPAAVSRPVPSGGGIAAAALQSLFWLWAAGAAGAGVVLLVGLRRP